MNVLVFGALRIEVVFLEEAFLDVGTVAQGFWVFKAAISSATYPLNALAVPI